MKTKTLKSHLGVYKRNSFYREIKSLDELQWFRKAYPMARPIGSLHSYNPECLPPVAFKLIGPEFDKVSIDYDTGQLFAGSSARILDALIESSRAERTLRNSGNFFEQTIAGACLTSTHGYGTHPTMADSVKDWTVMNLNGSVRVTAFPRVDDVVIATNIITNPMESMAFDLCVCKIDKLDVNARGARFWAVLPYSSKEFDEATVFISSVKPNRPIGPSPYPDPEPEHYTPSSHQDWKAIKYWWAIDERVPWLRRKAQRAIGKLELPPWQVIASKYDIDWRYHPDPGWSHADPSFAYWAMRPTHTSHNIAFFAYAADTLEFIYDIIEFSEQIHPGMLKSFIGVRELLGTSTTPWAGNKDAARNAVDIYMSRHHGDQARQLQLKLQMKWGNKILPHTGKANMRLWKMNT